jgi:hypothetical protein
MRRSEAEDLVRTWHSSEGKVFRYARSLLPDEYVVFHKVGPVFSCDSKLSTRLLPDCSKDEFILMLINGDLNYVRDMTYSVSPLFMKTGGCQCGVWILKDSEYLHDVGCPKYKR